mgnify:CR=1 FL=1
MFPLLTQIPTPWGWIPIYASGASLGIALLFGWYFIQHQAWAREAEARALFPLLSALALLSGFVGARLLYLLVNPRDFGNAAALLRFRQGGYYAAGALIAALWVTRRFCRKTPQLWFAWVDRASLAFLCGLVPCGLGLWLYGSPFGSRLSPSAPSWLASLGTFPRWHLVLGPGSFAPHLLGAPAWRYHVEQKGLSPEALVSFPVHPVTLYEAAFAALAAALLLRLRKSMRFPGEMAFWALSAYALGRLALDFLREDPERGLVLGALDISQLLALLWLLAAYWIFRRIRAQSSLFALPEGDAAEISPSQGALDESSRMSGSSLGTEK